MFDSGYVSIPHRYGKNTNRGLQRTQHRTEFPFLIGTVRTRKRTPQHEEETPRFPFLIGTVRTENEFNITFGFCGVSIPHRYGKNLGLSSAEFSIFFVSIPHRYGKNQAVGLL